MCFHKLSNFLLFQYYIPADKNQSYPCIATIDFWNDTAASVVDCTFINVRALESVTCVT